MQRIHRSLFAAAAVTATLELAACTTAVEGDAARTYGEVVVTVVQRDTAGAELARDERRGNGAELVAPLDRDLYQPIEIDGARVSDPSGLFAAREARIGEVVLRRETDSLRASGETPIGLRAARREGAMLAVEVEGGRFEIQLAGAVSADSVDRFIATALVRLVRGEALLADDCRPECMYGIGGTIWLCEPMRDALFDQFGADCKGPVNPDEWLAIEQEARSRGKEDACGDQSIFTRPFCEWIYDRNIDQILGYLEPDSNGMMCASDFYDRCKGGTPDDGASSCGVMSYETPLGPGNFVESCDSRFYLIMQADGNLVLYQTGMGPIWATGTNTSPAGFATVMQEDGNVVVSTVEGYPLWASGTWGNPGSHLAVQNDGNLVVYNASGSPIWASNTCCH